MAMIIIGYNLVKAVSQEAARVAHEEIKMISFKEVLDWINATTEQFSTAARKSNTAIAKLYENFIAIASTKLINERPYRWEPRMIKKRPKPFPRLQESRQKYKEMLENGLLNPALS